jgi:hypothetical protein
MRGLARALVGVALTIVAIVPVTLHADTVQLSVHDGRVSLVATNATPAQIFDAWSRAGGVLIVNADRIPPTPLTLTLDNVPEEQALDTLLRPVSGYLARHRTNAAPGGSTFDRIVILATPPQPREPTRAAAPPAPGVSGAPAGAPAFPQPPRPTQPAPPTQTASGIPVAPGVTRLVGPDGQPIEDDQGGVPPPQSRPQTPPPYNNGDTPPPFAQPRPTQPTQQGTPTPSAPSGVPVPGMVVPAPSSPGQAPNTGRPVQQPGH